MYWNLRGGDKVTTCCDVKAAISNLSSLKSNISASGRPTQSRAFTSLVLLSFVEPTYIF